MTSLLRRHGLRLCTRRGACFAAAAATVSSTAAVGTCCKAAPSPSQPVAEVPEPTLLKKCLAEALGVGIIVQGGCGVVCAAKYTSSGIGSFGVSAVWGLVTRRSSEHHSEPLYQPEPTHRADPLVPQAVALAVYATREVSGAHLNPAITCALVATDKCSAALACPYVAAQIAGGAVAGAVNYAIFAAGIAASELSAGLVRGTAASTASFHGAFGMVPNAAIVGAAGAFAAEVSGPQGWRREQPAALLEQRAWGAGEGA